MLMNDIVVIKGLTFKYGEKLVLQDLDLTVKNNSWITILGPSGSGKSALLKILSGDLEADGYFNVDGLNLPESKINIKDKVGAVFEEENPIFLFDTVYDELSYALENLGYTEEDIFESISTLFSYLEISYTLNENPNRLSSGCKNLLLLLKLFLNPPKILIIDNVISSLSDRYRKNILNYLKYLQKQKGITIIHATNNPEDTLESNYVAALIDGKIEACGPRDEIYNDSNVWKKLNMALPFMVDLSTKLKYYNLVDDIIINMDEMVDKLWN